LTEGKSKLQITWSGQKITDLAKRDLTKLVELISSANGKMNIDDLRFLLKLIIETKELLFKLKALRKEP